MQPFDYYKPTTFDEAFQYLIEPGKKVLPLAGATDLIPKTRDEVWHPDAVVDIKGLPGLRDIIMDEADARLYVGAAASMTAIARSEIVKSHWNVLAQGAASMGNEQIRNRATLGGNLCTASPAADTAAALLVLEATVYIKGPAGDRSLPIAQFFVGPGKTALHPGEIVAGVFIPKPPEGSAGHYEKLSRRKAGDLAIVGVAALACPHNGGYRWRVALSAVAPTPIRSADAEHALNSVANAEDLLGVSKEAIIEEAALSAYECCCPISDVRSSADYRRAMVIQIARRAMMGVLEQLEAK